MIRLQKEVVNNMKEFYEMLEEISPFLKVENALEQGFSNGKYTRILSAYAKNVTGIDLSEDFYNMATENLEDLDNVNLLIMDAEKMTFEDKSFDVLLNTSFHEFDLSNDLFSLDLDLKRRILLEMIRVSDTIIFIEPTENAVTNELFKVFNPNENHAERIKKSNELIKSVMQENGYDLVVSGLTYNRDEFNTKEELDEEMLAWWSDIKIPENDEEKQKMINKIDEILENAGMLQELQVTEEMAYNVFKRR